jgi:uncharacterized membrane protein
METYVYDWLGLLVRWAHVIAGIAWIGSSFYFIWLDNSLTPPAEKKSGPDSVAGELYAVHGGGFYHSEKFQVAPSQLPPKLHWFYWEAYTTWITGFVLLILIYYAQAELYLIDPAVATLSKPEAIGVSIAFLVGGWLLYDGLCRSPLARNDTALTFSIGILFSLAAWASCLLFSGRGAFVNFGAVLGTVMVANVLFVIIPGQRELVRAKQEGKDPDPVFGKRGKQRSVHNTYFTLPVLFTMVSTHYAFTFGAKYNWLVLIGISFAGALIRVWFVARHKAHERGGKTPRWPAIAGVAILLVVALALRPASSPQAQHAHQAHQASVIAFAEIETIFERRCQACHAQAPTYPGFIAAPAGVVLDTPSAILANLQKSAVQLRTRAMPIGNLTQMTEEERMIVLKWIDDGAPH